MMYCKLIHGNCIKVMKSFPDNCIDLVVTDPPYGISFMGKKWDKALPPKEAFSEMFRVLKPGALAFVMSSPRQDVLWRMMSMLEDVNFELRQSPLYWSYATGFPKAYNVSLGIDRKVIREEFIEEYGRKPTKEELKELMKKKRVFVGKGYSKSAEHLSRQHQMVEKDSPYYRPFKKGMPNQEGEYDITESYSVLAKKWSGWKSQTGLKPAVEVVLMVNKPRSEGTIVENVLKWGTGAVNVDECRIPFVSEQDKIKGISERKSTSKGYETYGDPESANFDRSNRQNIKGRFPANLLVSDDVLDTGKIHKKGGSIRNGKPRQNLIYGEDKRSREDWDSYGDSGGFSRFFSLDAWWREQIKKLPHDVQKTFPFLCVPKASKAERDKGLDNLEERELFGKYQDASKMGWTNADSPNRAGHINKRKNIHPTVKPVKLMSFLVTLGCPSNGVVLDPFVGSGTTSIAACMSQMNSVGIDLNSEYIDISEGRIEGLGYKVDVLKSK